MRFVQIKSEAAQAPDGERDNRGSSTLTPGVAITLPSLAKQFRRHLTTREPIAGSIFSPVRLRSGAADNLIEHKDVDARSGQPDNECKQ